MIPIYIFHLGNQLYFQKCVEINSKYNKVYVIGDDSNESWCKNIPSVTHIHIHSFIGDELKEINGMIMCFHNYSTSRDIYELNCFLRVFYLKELIKRTNIPTFFHIDSDCLIFESLENIPFTTSIQYSLQKFSEVRNPFHMVGSIHNGLLNMEFCDKFIQLCFDIYENKSKKHLIMPKVSWHKNYNIAGGICDMTLYYLLYSENIIDVSDTNNIIVVNGEESTFDHQISGSYGYLGENTYKMNNNIKQIEIRNNKIYFVTRENKFIRALSIHFQGSNKKIMENLSNEANWMMNFSNKAPS
jgi:hypothetical protein